jgi:hypothetical protein
MVQGFDVHIHREESRLKQQVACLMRQQLNNNIKKNRLFVVLLFTCTVISTVLVLTFKERVGVGVSGWFLFFTSFLWLGAIVFGGTALLNYVNGKRLTKSSVEEYMALAPDSRLQVDNESISYITADKKLTYPWSAITEWFEKEGTLFLVPEKQILKAFYFSKEDIGEEAFAQLRSLASTQIR